MLYFCSYVEGWWMYKHAKEKYTPISRYFLPLKTESRKQDWAERVVATCISMIILLKLESDFFFFSCFRKHGSTEVLSLFFWALGEYNTKKCSLSDLAVGCSLSKNNLWDLEGLFAIVWPSISWLILNSYHKS